MSVRFQMRGAIGLATLDDVPRRNALSRDLVRGMFVALDQARAAKARALVITGEGPTFCAGANITDLRDGWMEGSDPSTDPMRLFEALTSFPRPVIAAVNGPAVGGGFELTLSCDVVVASRAAWFALPELGHGVIPNTALARLPLVVGVRRAADLILRRKRISADEALDLGLATEVVETEAAESAVSIAENIVQNAPPGAIAVAKRHLYGHANTDWTRIRTSLTEVPEGEWREGLDAFTERRPVSFERFWDQVGQ